jgi:hypothetical protein
MENVMKNKLLSILMTYNPFYLVVLFVFESGISSGQNAPVATAASFVNATPGTLVTIPVTVTGFTNIGSFSLSLDYDYTKVQYVSGIKNPLIPESFSIGDNNLGNGIHRLVAGWYGLSGISLPDESWIISIDFTYLSGSTSLQWIDNGPSCAYSDGNGNGLNDIPASSFYINGRICGNIVNPGIIAGDNSVCRGESNVIYSIEPLENVSGYNWQVPPGASITSGWNTNIIMLDYSTGSSSGNIVVNGLNPCESGAVAILPVTVDDFPSANAGNDTTILYQTSVQLHAASGGPGSCSYHWSPENLLINPDLQEPQTVILSTTTVFFLTVTNLASQCQATDYIMVTTMGGPLTSNPTEIPGEICSGQSARLFSNAGGGSGNYTFSWTCIPPGNPPWSSDLANPIVSPDTATLYHSIVSDENNVVSGNIQLGVHFLPTGVISGGDTICADGSQAGIQIDFTGTPPWNCIYSNGLTSWSICNQASSPFITETDQGGNYSIFSIEDSHCSGQASGTAEIVILPGFSVPVISFEINTLVSSEPLGNQWYFNMNAIPGANGQMYFPTQSGSYFVICSNSGCFSDTSNIIDVIINNINQIEMNLFTIYPNPVEDYFMLKFADFAKGDFTLMICSVIGKPERVLNLNINGHGHEQKVEVADLPTGVHFLLIDDRYGTYVQKLVKF